MLDEDDAVVAELSMVFADAALEEGWIMDELLPTTDDYEEHSFGQEI